MKSKTILMLTLFFLGFYANAQERPNVSKVLTDELLSFSDIVNPLTISNGKYNVYVVNFNSVVKDDDTIHFTMSYIRNDYELEYVFCNYFVLVHSQLCLIYLPGDNMLKYLHEFNLTKINDSVNNIVLKKLWNTRKYNGLGGINGATKAEICWIKNGVIKKIFYSDSDKIPKAYSIYDIDRAFNGAIIREVNPATLEPLPVLGKRE